MITSYIGVGTNLERRKHVEAAVRELSQLGQQLRLSQVYECDALGFDSHPFYNLVIELKTELTFTQFSQALRNIELKWGRRPDAGKLEDRTLDLDIILFGEMVSDTQPEIPRSDIYKYPFVLQPLYELCPQRVVPGDGRTIAALWQAMPSFQSLTLIVVLDPFIYP